MCDGGAENSRANTKPNAINAIPTTAPIPYFHTGLMLLGLGIATYAVAFSF
jgi:hypothetical protein